MAAPSPFPGALPDGGDLSGLAAPPPPSWRSEAETEHKLDAIKAVCDSGLQPAQVWIQLSVLLEVTKSYGLPLG